MWGVSGKAHKTACDNCGRSTGQAPSGAIFVAKTHIQSHDYKASLHLRTYACTSCLLYTSDAADDTPC
eukprot:505895-Pleurochrysis_carterae.AAC.1